MNSNTIYFNQTLHGYIEGHTLIASSMELPPEVKRIMLLLSDMSGSRMEKGFDEYITGYPIKELNRYALAKTWYAPEMKRPGCVWTHTILVDFQDVPKISNVQMLLSFFIRPILTEFDKEVYLKQLRVNSEIEKFDQSFNNNLSASRLQTGSILKYLYQDANKSLLIRSSSSQNFDQLALMIWRQQWPRLKRNFSFCTGAISPRNIKGELLDFQIIPYSSDQFNSKTSEINLVDLNDPVIDNLEPWLEFIASDLLTPSLAVHSYFNYFGSDISIKKSAFKSLAESYIFLIKEKPVLENCIQFLAKQFPSQTEASNLKNSLLDNNKSHFANILPSYNETALLYHLTITDFYQCFDYEKLNYKVRFFDFFKSPNEQGVKLLKNIIKAGPNPNGEVVITELAELLGENVYLNSIFSDRQLLSVFVNLNPKLTFNKNFWVANLNNHGEIINQLKRANIGQNDWQKILNILIEINSDVDPHVLENPSLNIEAIILDRLNKSKSQDIGRNWLDYLKIHPAEVLKWFSDNRNPQIEVVELIVSVLNPNSNLVVKNGLDSWVQFLTKIDRDKNYLIKIDVHAFCLSLAFNVNSTDAQKIFETSFEIIYFALASDSLDYNLWKNIESHTKPLSFWKDWDKCKKIVIALADFYVKNGWSIKQLVLHIYSEDLKEKILRQYKKRR